MKVKRIGKMEEEISSNKIPSQEMSFIVTKTVGSLLFNVFAAMGVFYCLWKGNWNSAAWCLLLELACVLLLHITRCYVRSELHLKFSSNFFRALKYTAAVMSVCSWCAFVTYIVIGAVNKEEFEVRSHYAAAPITFMAGFWYTVLFFDSRKYETMLE